MVTEILYDFQVWALKIRISPRISNVVIRSSFGLLLARAVVKFHNN